MPAIGRSLHAACAVAVAAVELLAERLQPLDRLRLQPAVGQFLDSIGEPAFQEAAVVGRRLGSNRSRHIAFSAGVGVVFSAATRARTVSVMMRPPPFLATP